MMGPTKQVAVEMESQSSELLFMHTLILLIASSPADQKFVTKKMLMEIFHTCKTRWMILP